MPEPAPRKLHLADVIAAAEELHELTPGSILRFDRHKHISDVRRMVAFVGRAWLDLSYPRIGAIMLRDHSTIVHHCKEMARLLRKDRSRMREVRDLVVAAQQRAGMGRLRERVFANRMNIILGGDDVVRWSEPAEEAHP